MFAQNTSEFNPIQTAAEDPWSITVCDDDFDGFTEFTFEEISSQLSEQFQDTVGVEDEVYIANSYNGLIKIENVSTNANRVNVCSNSPNTLYEVAIDQDMTVYVSTRSGLYSVNTNTCNYQFVGSLPDRSNLAMSFDTQNNLYVGGRHSKVYRFDAGQFSDSYVWHDFGTGSSGGDFVVIGEYMYIAWAINNSEYYLYKVTIDDDNQYVSHENLGTIIADTYGLAAENGILYGVTPDYLYQIDLPSLNTSRVIQNSSSTPWWGAAGLHEAISYDFSYHLTQGEAQSGDNPLGDNFSNTEAFTQQIFIRVYNETTGEVQVITLNLNVVTPPETNATSLYQCTTGSDLGQYNLTQAFDEMIIGDTTGVTATYYTSQADAEAQNNPINNATNYQAISENQVIYVRFTNATCPSYNTITLESDAQTLDLGGNLSFCEGQSVTLSPNGYYDSYQWSGLQGVDIENNDVNASEITVTQAGTYTLSVGYGIDCTLTESITVTEEPLPTFENQTMSFCSDTNQVTVNASSISSDLSGIDARYDYTLFNAAADAQNNINPLSGSLNLTNHQTIFVRVKNSPNSDCFTVSELNIEVNQKPTFDWEENLSFCQGESLTLQVPDSFVSYQWSGLQGDDATQNDTSANAVEITQAGVYTIEVTNEHCTTQKQVSVTYEDAATIQNVRIEGNSATIMATGTPPLEYSFDNENWTSNPQINDLPVGEYTAYVRGVNVCGVSSYDFAIFSFTNVITPNNDGYNDTWLVKGLEAYPGSSLKIYNRYGKLLVDKTIDGIFEWDGTYKGKTLSSGSYWYSITITDGRQYRGHITIKNYR